MEWAFTATMAAILLAALIVIGSAAPELIQVLMSD